MPDYTTPSAEEILATRDSMIKAKARFETAITEVQRLRTEVDSTVTTLVGPGWGGSTATRFGAVMGQWDEQYQIVLNRLIAMTDTLQSNIDRYEIGDDEALGYTNTLGSNIAV